MRGLRSRIRINKNDRKAPGPGVVKADAKLEKILVSAGFSIRSLEINPDVIYVANRLLRLVYCNPAWDVFARENQGKQLERHRIIGADLLQGIPESLSHLYRSIYRKVLRSRRPWEHDYQCSSPTKYRIFHMRIFPLAYSHLLIENSLAVERPHRRKRHARFHSHYINRHGLIIMCAHCRRTEHFNREGRREWHWVPSHLATPPAPISHGLCPACVSYHLKIVINGQI